MNNMMKIFNTMLSVGKISRKKVLFTLTFVLILFSFFIPSNVMADTTLSNFVFDKTAAPLTITSQSNSLLFTNLPSSTDFAHLYIDLEDGTGNTIKSVWTSRSSTNSVMYSIDNVQDGLYFIQLGYSENEYGTYYGYFFDYYLPVLISGGHASFPQPAVYADNQSTFNSQRSDNLALNFYLKPDYEIQSNDSSIVLQAEAIISPYNDDYSKILAIHDWVSKNIYYDYDALANPPSSDYYTAAGTLSRKRSICQGYANLACALLRAAGIPAKVVYGYADWCLNPDNSSTMKNSSTNHAWTEAYLRSQNRWIILDTTWDSSNIYSNGVYYAGDRFTHKYFDPTVLAFSLDHRLDFVDNVPNYLVVTFNSQGGSAVASKTAVCYATITVPTAPTRLGYTFGGWYKEPGCTNKWYFETDQVTANITLYAKWTINSYTVTFNSQGGSTVAAKSANYNSLITAPTTPAKTGYTFGGWYKEPGCTNAWDFETDKVTADTTLYAKWITIKVISLIGRDRYDTAVRLSQSQFGTSDTILIVNGAAMADGLGATPLAAFKNAPLLLTETKSLPEVTINEINRLKAKKAIIVGGTGVVSDNVKYQLQALGLTVDRISGNNRYGTSLEVAKYIDKNCYDVSKIVIANGYGEADALSIASAAGRDNMPIILTEKDNIPSDVYNWLASESIENAYIIGGTGVVSDNVLNKIDGITTADVRKNRLGGQNRFETNSLVIDRFYGSNIDKTYIAKGYLLIDALAAGPVAAINGAPVVLSGNDLSAEQKTVLAKRYGNTIIRTGGGISDTAVNSLKNCLQ